MTTRDEPILRLSGICFGYPGEKPILSGVDLSLYRGSRIGLMGPNGSGKTTLFHLIMGLLKPTAGSIEIFGKKVSREGDFLPVRQRIGLLFQDSDDQLFSPTVIEDVAFGPLNLGKTRSEAAEIARKTILQLGLGGFEERLTHKLSGGEKRLVSLATVLAMEPEVLLLDEPTNGLDEITKSKIREILIGLGLSYILISHDFDFLEETTDTVCLMKEGKILTDAEIALHRHIHAHRLGGIPHEHE
ncbi:MAG: ABC transporter ATP-binding protein [Desulfobacteraceae bacterium]|nr:MAG: ABC transporter ATP-binding protein [Desulfobacteraceae bacterium]